MRNKVAIFGGSFNPPGTHHRLVAEALIPHFEKVIVLPCGPRPDAPTINDVEPWHRAALADIAFRDLPHVDVDLSDLELSDFTTNDLFEERFGHLGEIWHVVGSDLAERGGEGESYIQKNWKYGADLWHKLKFCIVARPDHQLKREDLPPNHMLVEMAQPSTGTSQEIREKIFRREPYRDLVSPEVAAYIERYGIYRGRIASRRTRWSIDTPRLLIVADERNARAMALAKSFRAWENHDDPNCILVFGGDGTMLRAIREHWRRRVPFLGINQGHLGFLLNEPESIPTPHNLTSDEFLVRLMPMIYVEVEGTDGQKRTDLAFNDAWVERNTSQSAWFEFSLNGRVRIPKLVADGALVCTAAGSTAYARSMGASPLLADTPGWIMVGSNVMTPSGWKSALLAPEATVSLTNIGGEKRPLHAYVDGREVGDVSSFQARLSRIATVELIFTARHDMAEKIARVQFPAE